MRFLLGSLAFLVLGMGAMNTAHAAADDFFIIDEADGGQSSVVELTNKGGEVWDTYDDIAHDDPNIAGRENLANQIQTGILTRDSLIHFLVELLQFLSQLGILIAVLMTIFVGYKYAAYAISGVEPQVSSIWHAIAGVVLISFAAFIMRALLEAFL